MESQGKKRVRSEQFKAHKAERIPCKYCGNPVRRDNMSQHIKIKHIETNELTPVEEIIQKPLNPSKNQVITIQDLIEEKRILIEEIKKINEEKKEIKIENNIKSEKIDKLNNEIKKLNREIEYLNTNFKGQELFLREKMASEIKILFSKESEKLDELEFKILSIITPQLKSYEQIVKEEAEKNKKREEEEDKKIEEIERKYNEFVEEQKKKEKEMRDQDDKELSDRYSKIREYKERKIDELNLQISVIQEKYNDTLRKMVKERVKTKIPLLSFSVVHCPNDDELNKLKLSFTESETFHKLFHSYSRKYYSERGKIMDRIIEIKESHPAFIAEIDGDSLRYRMREMRYNMEIDKQLKKKEKKREKEEIIAETEKQKEHDRKYAPRDQIISINTATLPKEVTCDYFGVSKKKAFSDWVSCIEDEKSKPKNDLENLRHEHYALVGEHDKTRRELDSTKIDLRKTKISISKKDEEYQKKDKEYQKKFNKITKENERNQKKFYKINRENEKLNMSIEDLFGREKKRKKINPEEEEEQLPKPIPIVKKIILLKK